MGGREGGREGGRVDGSASGGREGGFRKGTSEDGTQLSMDGFFLLFVKNRFVVRVRTLNVTAGH